MKTQTGYFYKYHFKVAAVKTANHPEIETKAVAEALNIHPFMLSRWKKQYREGVLSKDTEDMPRKDVEAELLKARQTIYMLKQQLKHVQEENKILKKAERILPGKK